MRSGMPRILPGLLTLAAFALHAAPREPVPLNDYTRLGQRFTASNPVAAVAVTVPSWSDNEGGLTLTLWDSPQRSRQLARRVFENIPDNAPAELVFTSPLPAGSYYWEIAERTGQTRIGLYADLLPEPSEDCAYLDGKPDPTRRFVFRTVPAPFPFSTMEDLVAALGPGRPLWDRTEACRQLAVLGGPEAIPWLAELLGDSALSHMARYALEPMPGAEVDRVFRDALGRLQGEALCGVVNSIGTRRDARAVPPLAKLLGAGDADAARAAAVALGRIGTAPAAAVLEAHLEHAPDTLRPALCEGILECAARLADEGRTRRARTLYDRLLRTDAAPGVRRAAVRGAVLSRPGAAGVRLLLEHLRAPDPVLLQAAIWVAQHELPGPELSAALARELPAFPPDQQPRLAAVLCSRGDDEALAAVLHLARTADAARKETRLAALRGLPRSRARAAAVAPVLLAALADPDDEVAAAAEGTFRGLPPGTADEDLTAFLRTGPEARRALAAQLLGTRRVAGALPALLEAAAGADAVTRAAALRALGEIGGAEQIPPLLELLAGAPAPEDRDAVEKALRGILSRSGPPDPLAERLADAFPKATPTVQQALLRLLQALGGSAAFAVAREAVAHPDPEVRALACRLLGEWKTPAQAPQLLGLAAAAPPAERVLFLRGALRLAAGKDLAPEHRLNLCRQASPMVSRDEEAKLLLAALAGIPLPDALTLALPSLEAPALQAEAAAAILSTAEPLLQGPHSAPAAAALREVAARMPDTEPGRKAAALLARTRPAPEPR